MSLSDKIGLIDAKELVWKGDISEYEVLKKDDVKQAIKELKESPDFDDEDRAFIDKIFGDKLI